MTYCKRHFQNLRDTSMEKLIDKLTKVVAEDRLKWIRTRVVRMYSYWTKAMKAFESRVNVTHQPRKKVSISQWITKNQVSKNQ